MDHEAIWPLQQKTIAKKENMSPVHMQTMSKYTGEQPKRVHKVVDAEACAQEKPCDFAAVDC